MQNLIDYFERRGAFGSARSYVGMATSQVASVFCDYYGQLSDPDRDETAGMLIEGALGQDERLSASVGRCLDLISESLHQELRNYKAYFLSGGTALLSEIDKEVSGKRATLPGMAAAVRPVVIWPDSFEGACAFLSWSRRWRVSSCRAAMNRFNLFSPPAGS